MLRHDEFEPELPGRRFSSPPRNGGNEGCPPGIDKEPEGNPNERDSNRSASPKPGVPWALEFDSSARSGRRLPDEESSPGLSLSA